jgi:hypothetical protein
VALPGGPLIPILALIVSLLLLSATTWANLIAGAAALALGGLIYRFRRPSRPAADGGATADGQKAQS